MRVLSLTSPPIAYPIGNECGVGGAAKGRISALKEVPKGALEEKLQLEFKAKLMHSGPGLLHSVSRLISFEILSKVNALWPWSPAHCFSLNFS